MRAAIVLVVAGTLGIVQSAGAQGTRNRLDELEARVAALEAAVVRTTVNCDAGESLTAVLGQHSGRSARVIIQLVGMCVESVTIFRSDVTLFGDGPGNGVQAPPGSFHALRVVGGGVVLAGLTLQAAERVALDIQPGASVLGRNLTVGAGFGGILVQNATLDLQTSAVEQTTPSPTPVAFGIQVNGGSVRINSSTVRNVLASNGGQCGICAFDGSSVSARNSTIEGNSTGIRVTGSHVDLFATSVRNNEGTGIDVQAASSLAVTEGAVSGNGGDGVLTMASHVSFSGFAAAALIEGNAGPGIRARLNSVVRLGPSVTIRTNGGGMQLSDGSIAVTDNQIGVEITGNQRGVICLGSGPGSQLAGYISAFGGKFHLNATSVFGNGPPGPNISCPGIEVP